jgi:hypothetical protein
MRLLASRHGVQYLYPASSDTVLNFRNIYDFNDTFFPISLYSN